MQDEHAGSIHEQPLDWRHKGMPVLSEDDAVGSIRERGWNVLAGDLLLPVLLLKESALEHNIELMAAYCREHGVDLAPHGKTTMAPQIVRRQLEAGAWGVTVATVSQARIFRRFGVERIVLANQLVEPAALRWAAAELRDPSFELYCLTDSLESVAAMARTLAESRAARPLPVLVELGLPGGRTGCRTVEQALAVAEAVRSAPALELAGVEGFEGIIHAANEDDTQAAVDAFLDRLGELALALARAGAFSGRDEAIVTVGGSAYFDRVVARLGDLAMPLRVRLVLRSGCYVVHDDGLYERTSPLAGRSAGGERLRAALEVWGVVLSRPEPDRAIVGMGKRDVAYDIELPIPVLAAAGGEVRDVRGTMEAFDLNDQHLYVRVRPDDPLAVGDLLACGISHPCTAFDKWRLIPVVDDGYRVIDAIATYF